MSQISDHTIGIARETILETDGRHRSIPSHRIAPTLMSERGFNAGTSRDTRQFPRGRTPGWAAKSPPRPSADSCAAINSGGGSSRKPEKARETALRIRNGEHVISLYPRTFLLDQPKVK